MAELDVDDVALMIPCTFCGAESDQWCVTRKGGVQAAWLHEARRQPVAQIRQLGWATGKKVGHRDAANAMHRLLFEPVEKADGEAISRTWLLGTFYRVRKELIP